MDLTMLKTLMEKRTIVTNRLNIMMYVSFKLLASQKQKVFIKNNEYYYKHLYIKIIIIKMINLLSIYQHNPGKNFNLKNKIEIKEANSCY